MSSQNEVQLVTSVIDAYAKALNSGDAKAIGGFYMADGAFLPHGHKTLEKKELDQISGKFLKSNNFRIEYKTQNVTVKGNYAIVESVATTNTSNSLSQTTRDLFILRNNEGPGRSIGIFSIIRSNHQALALSDQRNKWIGYFS